MTTPDVSTDARHNPRPFYQRSDYGNAQLLRDAYGSDLRYVREPGRWYCYRDGVWRDDIDATAQATAMRATDLMRDLAAALPDADRKSALRWAQQSAYVSRLRGMLWCAGAMLSESLADFDRHPYLLNCANGTVDLRTGELAPHDRTQLHTKTTGVPYDPGATCPEFLRVLARVQPDPDVRTFLERYFGMALIGEIRHHALAVMIGTGANGKTTVCEAVRHAVGDYGGIAPADLLTDVQRDGGPSDAVANLRGRRLVLLSETESGRRLREARVKLLTGGDEITARRLYENEVTFTPSHTLVMFTNHRPEITTGGDALWRRLHVVPFDVTIPETDQDSDLPVRMRAEAPGILTWLVNGCVDYLSHGLPRPEIMREATESYRDDEDVIGQFLADETFELPGARIERRVLWAKYTEWCEVGGYRPVTAKRFAGALRDHGVKQGTMIRGIRGWDGITLRSE